MRVLVKGRQYTQLDWLVGAVPHCHSLSQSQRAFQGPDNDVMNKPESNMKQLEPQCISRLRTS